MRGSTVALVVMLAGCGSRDEAEPRPAPSDRARSGVVALGTEERAALELAVATAVESDLPDVRVRYGRVVTRPGDETVVAAPFSGRISQLTALNVGDHVTAGTALATVSPVLGPSDRAALGVQAANLGGQVEQAQRELELHETALLRTVALANDGIVSQARLQEAETTVATAKARLRALRQGRAAQAGATGRATAMNVTADGTLVALEVVAGGAVETGQIVARILRAGPRRVEVAVGIQEPTGSAYQVETAGGWQPARLVARGSTIGPDGARHDLLDLDPQSEVLIGATVAVRIAAGPARGIVVPESAVLAAAGSDVVYVEREPGVFEARAVRVAARFGERVRLATGVKAGEQVVVRGAAALRGEALRSSLGGDAD